MDDQQVDKDMKCHRNKKIGLELRKKRKMNQKK